VFGLYSKCVRTSAKLWNCRDCRAADESVAVGALGECLSAAPGSTAGIVAQSILEFARLTKCGNPKLSFCGIIGFYIPIHDKFSQSTHALKEADMRILLRVTFPVEPFNTYVKDGSISAKMKRILDELKPEAAYFTEFGGRRTGVLITKMEDTSHIPAIAEPWFLTFNANVEVHPVMLPEDLAKSGLDTLGKKWA
jgi:hypothetical protein